MTTQVEQPTDIAFNILLATRNNILKILNAYSHEELLKVPEGFNNNLIWNAAHNVVTQQLLCYKLSGLEPNVSQEMIDKYRKGTKPTCDETPEGVQYIKELLLSTIDLIKTDFQAGKFTTYKEYTTSYGYTITSPEDAIQFNNVHEALHLGYMMALRKSL